MYTFPLAGGGYGACVVLRFNRDRRYGDRFCVLAGFRRRFPAPPSIGDLEGLTILDACNVSMYFDHRLMDGTWTRLGKMPGYDRHAWPLPLWRGYLTGHVIELDDEYLDVSPALVPWGTLPPDEYESLLLHTGCGTEDGMPGHLDDILDEPEHIFGHAITPQKIAIWEGIRARLRASGKYPPPVPGRAKKAKKVKTTRKAKSRKAPPRNVTRRKSKQ